MQTSAVYLHAVIILIDGRKLNNLNLASKIHLNFKELNIYPLD